MPDRQTRYLIFKAVFLTVVLVLLVLTLPACVSVQDNGQKTTAPPPAATVQFSSSPDPAEVFIDGQYRGSTPVSLQLAAGPHTIEFKLEGYQTWTRELVVVAGDDTRVASTLQRE